MLKTQTGPAGRQVLVFDPIHKVMQLPPELGQPLNRIIDSPLYQRLRGIRQMGMAEMVFPSATHSRLLHGLGACFLAYRIGSIVELDPEHLRLAVIAGLLHDIGHGPLSHAFELFLEEALGYPVRHELWTDSFINAGAVEHDWFDSEEEYRHLSGLITGAPKFDPDGYPGQLRLVGDIISSQLDADRLDYLLRDSHFCGVSYGIIDLEWLLYCMVPVETEQGLRLGITEKGIGSAEEFFMARRLMYQNVYYHKKIMAFEQMLGAFLQGLFSDPDALSRLGGPLAEFLRDLGSYRQRDAAALIRDKFSSYAQLRDYDLWVAIRTVAQGGNRFSDSLRYIAQSFEAHREPRMFRMAPQGAHLIGARVAAIRAELGPDAWKFDYKQVRFNTYTTDCDHPVASSNGNGQQRSLGKLSDLISLFSNHQEPVTYLLVDSGLYQQPAFKARVDQLVKEAGILQ